MKDISMIMGKLGLSIQYMGRLNYEADVVLRNLKSKTFIQARSETSQSKAFLATTLTLQRFKT